VHAVFVRSGFIARESGEELIKVSMITNLGRTSHEFYTHVFMCIVLLLWM